MYFKTYILYSAQAVKARLWGFTEKPGINGKRIREEMRSLEFFDRSGGSISAEVKSGVNVLEYDALGSKQRLQARRGLALELNDIRQVFIFLFKSLKFY